ncbi:response regulator [Motilimonas cestriensis]|uniref:Response regulator n=1 Tax=Motilimonas cestriensis TaxID=2742685 RepID=A0ABS8W7A9_9GAMM|nr:response regulator [Motilimonas cestriensis]MCE2594892.1 response regulator [Motilimonas cestriensis]
MDKRTSTSLIVFHESHETVDALSSLLKTRFSNVFYADIRLEPKEYLNCFRQHHHSFLFIFAFDNPHTSWVLKKSLCKNESLAPIFNINHENFLLCDKSHRELAYQLCEKGEFYSYETIKPIYDNKKLNLSLKRAVEKISLDMALLKKSRELDELQEGSDQSLKALCDKIRHAGSEQSSKLDEVISKFDGLIGSAIKDELSQSLEKLAGKLSEQEVARLLDMLRSISVSPELDKLKQHTEQMFKALQESAKPVRKTKNKVAKTGVVKSPMWAIKPLKKITIVIADDQPVLVKILASMLEPKGFKVETASNGAEAIMKAKVSDPKLLLLDIDMPILDGIETIKACKKIPNLSTIPIIMLTSYSDKEHFRTCLESGAIDYIVKPTNAETLLKKVHAVIDQYD